MNADVHSQGKNYKSHNGKTKIVLKPSKEISTEIN
jgi:hypothetical protein